MKGIFNMSNIQNTIEATMRSPQVLAAVDALGLSLQRCALNPQEQFAAIALLAAKQISVLPHADHEDAYAAFGELVAVANAMV